MSKKKPPPPINPTTIWGLWSDRDQAWKPDPICGPCQTYKTRAAAQEAAGLPHNARHKYRPIQLEPIPF
jgi:hypothetical protein